MTLQPARDTEGHRAVNLFWVLLGLLAVLRGWFCAAMPLTGEEAYYWLWSQNLALSYFDHPPLTGWLIALTTRIFGHSPFGVRSVAILCHTLTAGILCHATWRVTRDGVKAAWAGTCFTLGIFFAATGMVTIPDSVLFLFWALTVWLVLEAIRPNQERLWPWAGLALGLCGLAKFHGVLLAAATGLFVLLSRRQRRHLRSPWFWSGVLLAGLATLPVWIWNMEHGWPTFGFQLSGRHKTVLGSPIYVLEMLGAPFGYIGPVLFPLCVVACVKAWRRAVRQYRHDLQFLVWAAAVPFLFFLVFSIFIRIDPQWAAPAFISAIIPTAMYGVTLNRDATRRRITRHILAVSTWANAVIILLACGLLIVIMQRPGLVPRDIQILGHRTNIDTEVVDEFYGWKRIGTRLRKEIERAGGPQNAFIWARMGFGTAANIAFYAGGEAPTFVFDRPPLDAHQFAFIEAEAELQGANAVIIAKKEKYMNLEWLSRYFERVERANDLIITHEDRVLQRFLIARGYNLQRKPVQPAEPD